MATIKFAVQMLHNGGTQGGATLPPAWCTRKILQDGVQANTTMEKFYAEDKSGGWDYKYRVISGTQKEIDNNWRV